MAEINTHFAACNDGILTSTIVSLILVALHLLRDRCIPLGNQRKMVLFFNHPKLDQKNKVAPNTHLDRGASCIDSSDLNTTLVNNADDRATKDMILYEDEHLVISSKMPKSLKPKILCAFRHSEPKYNGAPFPDPTFGQYLMGGFIYTLQLYTVYLLELSARKSIPSGFLRRMLAAIDLAVPMTVTIVSTLIFVTDITSLKENHTDTAKVTKAWVLPAFGIIVPVGMACLFYGFATSI